MITRKIQIDGREVLFGTSAAIPRLYRTTFGRDVFQDLNSLQEKVAETINGPSGMDVPSLEIFENIAYLMAKHADPSVPDTPEEWLDGFETFSIYQVLPEIIELWGMNAKTDVQSKKKPGLPSVR